MQSQKPQNKPLSITPFLAVCLSVLTGMQAQSPPKPDELVELNDVTLRTGTGKWLQATVSFTPKKHPNVETAYNKEFIDDVKLSLYIAFYNRTREINFRKERKKDYREPDLFDYYSSEVEILTMKVDNSAKQLHFLLPNELAERDGFHRNQKPVGYVVEMTIGGKAVEFKEGIQFESGGRKYSQARQSDAGAIQKFKEFAKAKSKDNEGLLIPAHEANVSYLQNAPAVRLGQPSNSNDQ